MLLQEVRQAKILIVDDDDANLKLLQDVLHFDGYTNIKVTSDPRGVLSYVIENQPDLIILDLNMPYIDGFQLLELILPLLGETDYLPILIVSAESSFNARRRALTGGASDFLVKPYIAEEVLVRVSNMLRMRFLNQHLQGRTHKLEEEVRNRTQELEGYQMELKQAQVEIIVRLARAAEHRDDETGKHTQRVGLICALLAQTLGCDDHQVELIHRAAPLHDVGKIGVPDSILLKRGPFTEAERKIMQRHCEIGAELLGGGHSEIVQTAESIALTHHEFWDGSGYPLGMQKGEIPVVGRILAVADVFDALTHERPYKPAWPLNEALAELEKQSGRQFDPDVVKAFQTLPHEDLL